MAEEIPAAPSHHRPLPTAAAPAPSSSISLRPHQAPPPPAVAPSRPAGGPARIDLDRPRHRLRSLVVGELGPLLGGEPAPDGLPEVAAGSAAVDGGAGAPAPTLSPPFGLSVPPLPPPPAELPPGFTPVLISDAPVVSTETAWVEVGGRRRPRPEKAPVPSPRMEAGLPPAFKRRTYGLCFRCLSPDHFVVDCHGPVRCLRCRHSGHRVRDCEARFSARKEHHPHSSSPPVPPCRPKDPPREPRPGSRPPPAPSDRLLRSWASVVSHQDAINLEACGGSELGGLVASQLEEMAAFELRRMESVQGLMKRLESLVERVEVALEKLSVAPAVVQTAATQPPLEGINGGCADDGVELFGCYSPRNATNPVGELFHEIASMMSGSPIGMQVGEVAPSSVEQCSCRLDREMAVQEMHDQLSPAVAGEVCSQHETSDGASCERGHVGVETELEGPEEEMQQMVPSLDNEEVGIGEPEIGAVLPTDQGEAGLQLEKDIVTPAQACNGQQDLGKGVPPCPLSGFLSRISVPLEVSVLGTPDTEFVREKEVEAPSVRRSGRIAKLHPEGANMEQLAMEAVARRLGSQPEEANPSERLRQDYLALWGGQPLTDQAVAAIDDLVLSVKKPKKKKVSGTGMARQRPPEIS